MPDAKPKPNRKTSPLYLMLKPEERERLFTFAEKVGRPVSWVVRDALAAYLRAVTADQDKLEALRLDPARAMLDIRPGETDLPVRGRPRKLKAGAGR